MTPTATICPELFLLRRILHGMRAQHRDAATVESGDRSGAAKAGGGGEGESAHLFTSGGELLLSLQVAHLLGELLRVRELRGVLPRKGAAAVALGEPRHERPRKPCNHQMLLARARQHS